MYLKAVINISTQSIFFFSDLHFYINDTLQSFDQVKNLHNRSFCLGIYKNYEH